MIRRWIATAGVLAVACAFTSVGVALASGTARLQGKFRTRVTVTQVSHFAGTHVGQTGVVPWRFTPRCATGTCATVLKRRTFAGLLSTETLKPSASGYEGKAVEHTACTGPNGKVRVSNGYTLSQTLSVHPDAVRAGRAHGFSGVGNVRATPTAEAKAHHCAAASETFRFHNV